MDLLLSKDKGAMRDMGFIETYERIKRPNETFILQALVKGEKDEVGNLKNTWEDVQELKGIIQRLQTQDIDESGTESELSYKAYFVPNFILYTNKLENYRIKYTNDYETLYLKIKSHNPNLFNHLGQRSHYETELVEDKKYA